MLNQRWECSRRVAVSRPLCLSAGLFSILLCLPILLITHPPPPPGRIDVEISRSDCRSYTNELGYHRLVMHIHGEGISLERLGTTPEVDIVPIDGRPNFMALDQVFRTLRDEWSEDIELQVDDGQTLDVVIGAMDVAITNRHPNVSLWNPERPLPRTPNVLCCGR